MKLSCPKNIIPGDYAPSLLRMQSGKLAFDYEIPLKFQRSCKIRVYESEDSVLFYASKPANEESCILFHISTRKNTVYPSHLRVSSLTSIAFTLPQASISVNVKDSEKEFTISCPIMDDIIVLPTMQPYSSLSFLLPFLVLEIQSIDHKLKLFLSEQLENNQKALHSSVIRLSLGKAFKVDTTISYTPSSIFLEYKITGIDSSMTRMMSFCFSPSGLVVPFVPENEQWLVQHQKVIVAASLDANISSTVDVSLSISFRQITKGLLFF